MEEESHGQGEMGGWGRDGWMGRRREWKGGWMNFQEHSTNLYGGPVSGHQAIIVKISFLVSHMFSECLEWSRLSNQDSLSGSRAGC